MEKSMNKPMVSRWYIIPLVIVFAVLSWQIVLAATSNPTGGIREFNATPDTVYINWTNSFRPNITVNANFTTPPARTNFTVTVLNSTTDITLRPNYTQPTTGFLTECAQLPLGNISLANGTFSPITDVMNSTIRNTTNVTINFNRVSFWSCMPGRYFNNSLVLRNTTNSTENLTLNIVLDIPITTNNTLSNTTGIGTFNGTISTSTNYTHSYYFFTVNTTTISNATSVVVNISGWSDSIDPDIFLLDDQGSLLARSNSRKTTEHLVYSNLDDTSGRTYEVRIYGNPTSSITYSGVIAFGTLDTVNTTTNTRIRSMDFGTRNSTAVVSNNIQLRNNGSLVLSDVRETKEMFFVKRLSGTQGQIFKLLVPDSSIISNFRAGVTWSGQTNFTVTVTDHNNNNYTSNNKSFTANFSGVQREEFVEVATIPSTAGVWSINVSNGTISDSYTVTILMALNASSWLTTNYTTVTLNQSSTGLTNSSQTVQVNFTVPNNTFDGTYEGNITYTASSGAKFSTPVRATITTPVLVVNNTLSSQTITVHQNHGSALNRTILVFVNNTGSVNLTLDMRTNSSNLFCNSGSCSAGHTMNLSYNTTNFLPSSGITGSNATIEINVTMNGSLPTGIYNGWVFFNGTNNTGPLSSHPYQTFNLTVSVNLTAALDARLISFLDEDGDGTIGNSTGNTRAINIKAKVFMINGTSEITDLTVGNFTTIFLRNTNNSEVRIPPTGGLTVTANATPFYSSSQYNLGATVPANAPGGVYSVNLQSTTVSTGQINSSATYTMSTYNGSIYVNNSGLFMSSNFTGCTMGSSCPSATVTLNPSDTSDILVNVTNLGLLQESGATITFSESCSQYSVAAVSSGSSGCASATEGNPWTVTVNAFTSSCTVKFRITANSSGSDSSCTGNIVGAPAGRFFNPSGINVTVTFNDNSTESSDSTSSSAGSAATTTTAASISAEAKYLSISKWNSVVEVGQGKSGSALVTVKNANDTLTQTVTLKVIDLNSTVSTSVSPDSAVINAEETAEYTVNFTVPDGMEVDNYPGKFQASSSNAIVTADFSLHVLPGAEAKKKINETFDSLKKEVLDLWKEINSTRAGGVNITLTQGQFDLLKAKLDEAEAFLALGTDQGYFAASQLFEEIRSLLNTTKSQLRVDRGGGFVWPIDPLYIGIGVGVAAVGFLIYLFLPAKGGIGRLKIGKQAGGAAGAAAGKVAEAAGSVKDTTTEQFKKLQEKFRLKREFKYKYKE